MDVKSRRCRLHSGTVGTTKTKKRRARLLIVDGYQQKSRDEFKANGLPLASSLYKDMLVSQSPDEIELEFDTIFPCTSTFVAPDDETYASYDGACFTGSSMSATSQEDDCLRQINIMKDLFRNEISTFGSCWGIQIAAVATGGRVALSPKGREVGIGRKISLTPEGRKHPMFEGKKATFEAFMSHSDEVVSVDESMTTVTAGNDHSRVQAMSVRHGSTESWFVQYHPEYDFDYFARLISTRTKRMTDMGFFQSPDDVDVYVNELIELHRDPDKKHLRWKHGVDEDMIDPNIKRREVKNWLRYVSSLM